MCYFLSYIWSNTEGNSYPIVNRYMKRQESDRFKIIIITLSLNRLSKIFDHKWSKWTQWSMGVHWEYSKQTVWMPAISTVA